MSIVDRLRIEYDIFTHLVTYGERNVQVWKGYESSFFLKIVKAPLQISRLWKLHVESQSSASPRVFTHPQYTAGEMENSRPPCLTKPPRTTRFFTKEREFRKFENITITKKAIETEFPHQFSFICFLLAKLTIYPSWLRDTLIRVISIPD